MAGLVCGVDIGGTFTDCVLIGEDGRVAYGKALSSPADSLPVGLLRQHRGRRRAVRPRAATRSTRRMDRPDLARLDRRHQHRGRAQGREDRADHDQGLRGHDRASCAGSAAPPASRPRTSCGGRDPQARAAGAGRAQFGVAERIDCARRRGRRAQRGRGGRRRRRRWSRPGWTRSRSASSGRSATTPTSAAPARSCSKRAPGLFVTISSEISKAVGEYERFVATLINAYVGPVTSRYLHGVQDRLGRDRLRRRAAHHAVPRRHGAAADRRRPPDLHDRLRPGRRADRLRAGVRRARHRRTSSPPTWAAPASTSGIIKDGEPLAADEHPARQVPLPRAGARGDLDRRGRRLDRLDRPPRRRPARRARRAPARCPAPPATTAAAPSPP